jgi:phage-related minor tail protein
MERAIGERVAVLETRVDGHDDQIRSLRESRHLHGNVLQKVTMQADFLEEDVKEMAATMTGIAQQMREVRADLKANDGRWGTAKSILVYAFGAVQTVATAVVIYMLTGMR